MHSLTLAAVAVVGITIGVAAVLISNTGLIGHVGQGTQGTTAAGGVPSSAPASRAPGQGGGGLPGLPPLTGSGGLQMMIEGRVIAVSSTSVTLAGEGPNVTARITGSTQFSGTVHAISGVKAGDQVAASLTGASMSNMTATSLDDLGTPS